MNFVKGYYPLLLAGIILLLKKIPDISLPFYWDEAWSYGNTITYLAHNSLNSVFSNPHLLKGHPSLFYLFFSTIASIFNNNIFILHIVAFLISILTIVGVYKLVITISEKKTAIIAVSLFMVQGVFVAQSTFVLPDMAMTCCTIFAFFYFYKKKFWATALLLTANTLIKETGIITAFALAIIYLIENAGKHPQKLLTPKMLYFAIPAFALMLHFLSNKILFNWFIYPDHSNLMHFSIEYLTSTAYNYLNFLMIKQFRWILFFLILLFLGLLYKKLKYKNELMQWGIFIVTYILFMSFNFSTLRYSLSILPFYTSIFAILVVQIVKQTQYLNLITGILVLLFAFLNNNSKKLGDESESYQQMVKVHQQTIMYCQQTFNPDIQIYSHFLVNHYISNNRLGYLSPQLNVFEGFKNLSPELSSSTQIVIISSIEQNNAFDKLEKNSNFHIVKTFTNKNAWCKIYQKKN